MDENRQFSHQSIKNKRILLYNVTGSGVVASGGADPTV